MKMMNFNTRLSLICIYLETLETCIDFTTCVRVYIHCTQIIKRKIRDKQTDGRSFNSTLFIAIQNPGQYNQIGGKNTSPNEITQLNAKHTCFGFINHILLEIFLHIHVYILVCTICYHDFMFYKRLVIIIFILQ